MQWLNKLCYMNIKGILCKKQRKGREGRKEDVLNECIFKIYYYNKLYNYMYNNSIYLKTDICVYIYTHTHNTLTCVCVHRYMDKDLERRTPKS